MARRPGWLSAVALLILAVTGCADSTPPAGTGPDQGVRIASFDFAESALLAELYAQVIAERGLPVVRMGRIGPREIIAPALELDRIDLVLEYLGTARRYAGAPDTESVTALARDDLSARLEPRGLVALEASPAQDRNVLAITREAADLNGLVRISDLSDIAADAVFGGPAECPDRELCLIGLESVYGLRFAEFVPQRSLSFTAEALRRGEIDVGLMFSTAAELTDSSLVVLEDDLGLQPAENVVPVVRSTAIDRWGDDLVDAADRLSGRLTTVDLRVLNRRVAGGDDVSDVAREWLLGAGLVQ